VFGRHDGTVAVNPITPVGAKMRRLTGGTQVILTRSIEKTVTRYLRFRSMHTRATCFERVGRSESDACSTNGSETAEMHLKFSHFCQVFQQMHLHSHTAMLVGCESTGATYHHAQMSRIAFGSRAALHRRDMNLLLAATVTDV
jgi:adenosine deaminase